MLGGGRLALATVVVSIGILGFWNLRHFEGPIARRAVSVANANDFSWRNRVAAWDGALQMMAERPWFGFGWNQPERVYDQFYRPSRVPEGAAIQLNDYLILGTTLGIPALACFVLYVLLAFIPQPAPEPAPPPSASPGPEFRTPHSAFRTQLTLDYSAVCRAAAVVLLVAFWFDGGLFKLATAAPFWILLELGRAGDHEIHEAHENA
jgi:O-antigen ligase